MLLVTVIAYENSSLTKMYLAVPSTDNFRYRKRE